MNNYALSSNPISVSFSFTGVTRPDEPKSYESKSLTAASVLAQVKGAGHAAALGLGLAIVVLMAACGSGNNAGTGTQATPVVVTTTGTTPAPISGTALWSCTFATSPTDCGFQVQEKVTGRATVVSLGRDGGTAVRLHTEPGDNNVDGSGDMERNDLWLSQADSDGYEGHEAWWGLSVRFPDDFVFPTWQRYALSGFHHTGSTGQGNFTLGFVRGTLDTDPGALGFQGYGGTQDAGSFTGSVGPVAKNNWYDLVYHVKWSSGSDGIFQVWVNGALKMDHRGPTMYVGQGTYFKLANYHTPLCDPYPACIGTDPPSSVIYDRVIRGSTALSVSSGPLEGVLTLVNGVLALVN